MTKKKKIILIGGGVLLIGAMVIVNLTRKSGNETEVQAEDAVRERIIQTVSASGKIEPVTKVNISANVSGKILSLGAEEGDSVKVGDLLVELDSVKYVASVEQMEALLRSVKADRNLAKANLVVSEKNIKRQRSLYGKGLLSEADYEAALANLDVLKARYQSAGENVRQSEARLKQTMDDLSKTRIYSPSTGIVIKLNKEVGEIALGSQFQEDVIMTVADLSEMEVLVEVDENDVVLLELGDSTDIELDAFPDKTFIGKVAEIANSAITRGLGTQEQVTNFEVGISMLEVPKNFRPGMSATVDIRTAVIDSAVVVPIQAVTVREPRKLKKSEEDVEGGAIAAEEVAEGGDTGDDDNEMVEVVFVIEDGIVKMRRVETGISSDTKLEILEGLDEGEKIVIGSYRVLSKELDDGDAVKIQEKKGRKGKKGKRGKN